MIRIDRSVDIKLIQPMQNLDPALGARMPYPPWPRLSSWKRRPRRCCATLICLSYGLIVGILIWNDDIDIYWWSPIVPTVVCLLMYVIYIYMCVCVSQVVEDGTGLTDPGILPSMQPVVGPPGQRLSIIVWGKLGRVILRHMLSYSILFVGELV